MPKLTREEIDNLSDEEWIEKVDSGEIEVTTYNSVEDWIKTWHYDYHKGNSKLPRIQKYTRGFRKIIRRLRNNN